jgi:heat shock protein HslJ
MRNYSASVVLVVLLTTLTAACSDFPTAPSDSSMVSGGYMAAQLEGTWSLSSIKPAGAQTQNRPDGATYTVTFTDGRLSTRADCNVCGGVFSISGNTLVAGPGLACTRAACPTMAFENVYTAILSGDSTTVLDRDTLTLSSSRGVLTFTR